MSMPIRVLVADDHTLVRAGFCSLLKSLDHIEVVGEAGDGEEAVRLVNSTTPHIIFMDIGMKELNGIEATFKIVQDHPTTRVIVLTMLADPTYVRRALRAGACGYLLKGAEVAELDLALKAVMRGETYLTPAISKGLVDDLLKRIPEESDPLAQLTLRQRHILQLLAEGCSTKEIAQRFDLSTKTIETHRADIMSRLDIHDIPGLVRFAIRTGLISAR
jgi:DNA-binding NarL/FixJ family response regulator